MADSAPNTGIYKWTSFNGPLPKRASGWDSVQVRLSGPNYVGQDSLRLYRHTTGIALDVFAQGNFSFSIPGSGAVLSGLASGSRIEIRDAGGSFVRMLSLGDGNLSWDLLDSRGIRVLPGMYFLRALHDGVAYRAGRALVL
jgi:hypothetical protein